ncbi:hypothetical protein OIO90_000869 [Microbotryomycetes sp. JL221]|nr:hypothetical protein OIO90_000869 [Microbotryomycetes sp. JL221]
MDTYPSEFISHHVPLMFVAGLNVPHKNHANGSGAPPSSSVNDAGPQPQTHPSTPAPASPDSFVTLAANLRKTLTARRSWVVWDNSRGSNHDFHVVTVDKGVRFPPLKARPASAAATASTSSNQVPVPTTNAPLHSPISPLTPTSPLYPDGIMAPIWIRKHREMTPAVFVLVLRLAEVDHASKLTRTSTNPLADNLDGPRHVNFSEQSAESASADSEQDEERRLDAQLVNEIVERKRSTVERGIKLAVILMCSRRLLENPTLDARLSLIRRQSGLDARASLFVISPVPQSEVNNFVTSLKSELYPAALDFYREHGRRVRRKRARQVPKGGLSDKGWTVRYDYKMGFFSEMRSETEVALKHYEDCYDSLSEMFSHSDLLPPRTKRWAEAKVLTDCLSVKVSKMYLYLNETARATAHFNHHVARFRDLSNGWGIGEQTFEFWSWLTKQYRLFGDLVATALRAGFRLPLVRPPIPLPVPGPGQSTPALVPSNVLHHPGFYYLMAASAAVERRDRFRMVQKSLANRVNENGQSAPLPASIMHESKVQHADLIIDLLTKAYEFFKHHKMKNMTVYVASQIALAHVDNQNHDMSLKFHERISRNFRRDRWNVILQSILRASVDAALTKGDDELALRNLLELIVPGSGISVPEREAYAQQLQTLLSKPSEKASDDIINIDMTDSLSLFECSVAFWRTEAKVGELVPFQLTLATQSEARSSNLVFDQIEIHFNDDRRPLVVSNAEGSQASGKTLEIIRISGELATTRLQWVDGSSKICCAVVLARAEGILTIDTVVLKANWNGRSVNLLMKPSAAEVWHTIEEQIQLQHGATSSCDISSQKLAIELSTEHSGPAYIGESFPFHVCVQNLDEVDAEVSLDLLLQPGEDDSRWEGATQVTMITKLHASGPDNIIVTGLKLDTSTCDGLRIAQSSLDMLPVPLNLLLKAGDLFNALFQLEVVPDKSMAHSGAVFEVLWRRYESPGTPSKTAFAMPALPPLTLEPAITLRLPPFVRLHEPKTLHYHLSNPTMEVVRLYLSFDSAPEPGTFVFAGPRREPAFLLMPDEERDLDITVVPLALGHLALPRMRVFKQEDAPPEEMTDGQSRGSDGQDVQGAKIRNRELAVVAEHDEQQNYEVGFGLAGQQATAMTSRSSIDGPGPGAFAGSDEAPASLNKHFMVTVLP